MNGSWVGDTELTNIYLIPLKFCIGVRAGEFSKTIDDASIPDWLFSKFIPLIIRPDHRRWNKSFIEIVILIYKNSRVCVL